MARQEKKKQTFAFTTPLSPADFKLNLREAVRGVGDLLYEDTSEGFDLGIERGGHSGGYWYVATLSERDGQTAMSGEIVYRSFHSNGEYREETKWEKILGWIGMVLIIILVLPIVLVTLTIWGIMELIGKLRKKPLKATMSTEEKLTHFMTEVMGCKIME